MERNDRTSANEVQIRQAGAVKTTELDACPAAKSSGRELWVVRSWSMLVVSLFESHEMLTNLLTSLILFSTLIAGFGLGSGMALTAEDMDDYAKWRVERGTCLMRAPFNGHCPVDFNMTDPVSFDNAVRMIKEKFDWDVGISTMHCTGSGILCSLLSVGALLICTKEHVKMLATLKPDADKTLFFMRTCLVLSIILTFVTYLASAVFFTLLIERAVAIKYYTCSNFHTNWVATSGAESDFAGGDCARRTWTSMLIVAAALILPLAVIFVAVLKYKGAEQLARISKEMKEMDV